MTKLRPVTLAIVAASLVVLAIIAIAENRQGDLLTQVYTPSFAHVPLTPGVSQTIGTLWQDLRHPGGETFLRRLLPSQGGALWLSLILAIVIAFDFGHARSRRNLDLLAMQLLAVCTFQILEFFRLLKDPSYIALMDWVFIAIFVLNALLIGRALQRLARPVSSRWRPGVALRPLMVVAGLLLACNTLAALVREPDDAGYFVNLGAQRLRERGRLPYGDPMLTGSAGAAYGPLLYVAHLPFQLALAPQRVNRESPDQPVLGDASAYRLPPPLATKLCTIAFHLLGVFALFVGARRLAGVETAWAMVVLYCGSAFVLGVGGEDAFIGGMTYISHIAPTAMTLVAFALLPRPGAAGVALALAAGVGFYPAFMAPAWLGFYWDKPRSVRPFLLGFGITCLAIGAMVLLLSRPAGDRGLVATILSDTFGHHTDPEHYGFSPFSFWGQKKGVRGWFNTPLVGRSGFTAPFFMLFSGFAAAALVLTRRRTASQLALVTAVIALGASLSKIQPTGTYVEWALPFLLLGFFADADAVQLSSQGTIHADH